jgi:manganese/zinc-transporting P-type ATPase C
VPEVATVEIDRSKATGRLRYAMPAYGPEIWRKLKSVLIPSEGDISDKAAHRENWDLAVPDGVGSLYLDVPAALPIRVTRVGSSLSTWRVQVQGRNRVRLAHPLLRNRKDIAFRIEQELTAILGVREFRTNTWMSSVLVRFDARLLDVERLVQRLEGAWPRLVEGPEGPPSKRRFFAAFSLLGLAFTGQYLVPALAPVALAGVAVYGFPNVISALKLLGRGKVALPVLYTGTLTFTLLSGLPFSAALMASFMQVWPQVAYGRLTRSQRRLFATHRQRPTWARLANRNGLEVDIDIEDLRPGNFVVVREGEVIPADGVIVDGLAAINEEALSGRAGALDKSQGDVVYSSTFVRAGQITLRVEKVGTKTLAGYIGTQLPQGRIDHLPCSAEAEEIANGMVLPALALSGLNLLVTGNVQPSQSTLRPDYATAPRFSAQFTTLFGLGDALRRGILIRNPAVLDLLPTTDIYVFDDAPALERRRIAVGDVLPAQGISRDTVLSYACAAFPMFQNERARALLDTCVKERVPIQGISYRARRAGVITYRDGEGRTVEVGTPAYIAAQGVEIPVVLAGAVEAAQRRLQKSVHYNEPQLRSLWVIREGVPLGLVTFERSGDLEAVEVIATLRARNPRATFVHVSAHSQARAEAFGARIGITTCHGDLDVEGKVRILRELGRRALWIGDGSRPDFKPCIDASTISISVAGARTVPLDAAAVSFLQPSLRSLVPLRRIGRHHHALLKQGYRAVFTSNLLCVAGALFAGFNTLAVALTSNFGTAVAYTSQRTLLSDLIKRMESKMAADVVGDSEDYDPQAGTSDAGAYEQEQLVSYHEHDLDAPEPEENPI